MKSKAYLGEVGRMEVTGEIGKERTSTKDMGEGK